MNSWYRPTQQTRNLLAERNRQHFDNNTGLSCRKNPVYLLYQTMLARCTNPWAADFQAYGGRGISVCARWRGQDGFRNFCSDLGPRPEGRYPRTGHSVYRLSRRDTDGDFCPENCAWGIRSTKTVPRTSRRDVHTVIASPLQMQLQFELTERERIAWKLSERFGWCCWYCNLPLRPVDADSRLQKNKNSSVLVRQLATHIDHIIPKVAGGTDDIDNLALACECCNRAKFNLHVDFFLAWLDRVKFAEVWTPIRDGRRSSPSLLKAS